MALDPREILDASILIVDDQEPNVSLLTQLLGDAGYTRVASTMNPLEVCALHRKHCYDLILLDLQMPGLDGFQVMEGLKTNVADSYLPVIVLTAQPGHKLRALAGGRQGFHQQAIRSHRGQDAHPQHARSAIAVQAPRGVQQRAGSRPSGNEPPSCAKARRAIEA